MAGRVEESVWEERREWIRKQQQSGLSVAHFCRDNSLHEAKFYAWRHRLAKTSAQSPLGAGKLSGGRQKLQAFVQLPLPPVATTSAGPSWIELSLADGMVVRVPASNLAALETVLRSLNGSHRESRHA
jgi:transposase-like protein